MKITSVEVSPFSDGPGGESVIVLTTDSARSGIAEIQLEGSADQIAPLTPALSALLMGRDPFDTRCLAQEADAQTGPSALEASLMAAGGTAMADIAGQELGIPVHQLMGGRVRDRVRACAIGWETHASGVDALHAAALDMVGQGFTALRVDPFVVSGRMDLSGAADVVRTTRDTLPDAIDLVVDGSALVDPDDALAFASLLEPIEVLWVEQTAQDLSVGQVNEVGHRYAVPVTAARGTTEDVLRRLIMTQTVDHIVVDVGMIGGLIPARRIAALAEIYHIGIVPVGSGRVSLATALHLAAAIPNLTMIEMRPGLATVEDGTVAVDLRPGLGIARERLSVEVA